MAGPEREDTGGLERPEHAAWIVFLASEVPLTPAAESAQTKIVQIMDHVAAGGGWCDHEQCMEIRMLAMRSLFRHLWKTPVTG